MIDLAKVRNYYIACGYCKSPLVLTLTHFGVHRLIFLK